MKHEYANIAIYFEYKEAEDEIQIFDTNLCDESHNIVKMEKEDCIRLGQLLQKYGFLKMFEEQVVSDLSLW